MKKPIGPMIYTVWKGADAGLDEKIIGVLIAAMSFGLLVWLTL